jgi:hypothetical protein
VTRVELVRMTAEMRIEIERVVRRHGRPVAVCLAVYDAESEAFVLSSFPENTRNEVAQAMVDMGNATLSREEIAERLRFMRSELDPREPPPPTATRARRARPPRRGLPDS